MIWFLFALIAIVISIQQFREFVSVFVFSIAAFMIAFLLSVLTGCFIDAFSGKEEYVCQENKLEDIVENCKLITIPTTFGNSYVFRSDDKNYIIKDTPSSSNGTAEPVVIKESDENVFRIINERSAYNYSYLFGIDFNKVRRKEFRVAGTKVKHIN